MSESWSNREEFLAAKATGAGEIDWGSEAWNPIFLVEGMIIIMGG